MSDLLKELFGNIPKDTKIRWTCASHPTCKTCKYYYSSCDGMSNHEDPRVKNMEHADVMFFKVTRLNDDLYNLGIMKHLHWSRIHDEFGIDSQHMNVSDDQIVDWIVTKHGEKWREVNK